VLVEQQQRDFEQGSFRHEMMMMGEKEEEDRLEWRFGLDNCQHWQEEVGQTEKRIHTLRKMVVPSSEEEE